MSDTRLGAALAPRAPLRPVAGHRQREATRGWLRRSGRAAAVRPPREPECWGLRDSLFCAPPRSPAWPVGRPGPRAPAELGPVRTRQPRLASCGTRRWQATRSRGRSPKIRAAADASAGCAAGRSGLPGARRRLDGLPVSRSSRRTERERQGAADAFPRRAGDRAVFTIDPSPPPLNSLVK